MTVFREAILEQDARKCLRIQTKKNKFPIRCCSSKKKPQSYINLLKKRLKADFTLHPISDGSYCISNG